MSTIFNILSMHRSQELTESLRAYDEQRANERAEKRISMIRDVCQEIRDYMTQDEYNAWFEAAPEEGFFFAACDQLLSMKLGSNSYDDFLWGRKIMTQEYRAQLHADWNAKYTK